MQIIINLKDECMDDIMAIGAEDLLNHFLPKIGVKAKNVNINHIDDENRELRMKGKEYSYYSETYEG